MHLDIRQATAADLAAVLAVLDNCAAWLQSIGLTGQWPPSFSADSGWARAVRGWVDAGVMRVVEADGGVVGVFRLQETSNAEVWRDQTPALYLFSLAVVRSAAGKGVGSSILDWVYAQAAEQGRPLRLDCWAGNERLRAYYAAAGFEDLGEAAVIEPGGREYRVVRFERR